MPQSDGERNGSIDRRVDDGETLWVLDSKSARQAAGSPSVNGCSCRPMPRRSGTSGLTDHCAGLVLMENPQWLELAGKD